MDEFARHKTLLALHRIVDGSLQPLLQPLDLRVCTEAVVAVTRDDVLQLSSPDDPQAAVISLADAGHAIVVLEPSLGHAVLSAIWHEPTLTGGYTTVESGILQQFVADASTAWNEAWSQAGIECLPQLQLAGPLSTVAVHMEAGEWYAVRSVVTDAAGEPVGVFLFCYPAAAMNALQAARESIGWKGRVARGLTDRDQQILQERLEKVGQLRIPAPVTTRVMLPLGTLQGLERGDVIALEANEMGELDMAVFDRPIAAQLAASGDRLALAVGGATAQPAYDENDFANDTTYAGDE